MSYTAPIKDMLFVLHELAGLKQIQQLPGCEEATDETVQAVLEENARFMSEVVAPLNWSGDTQPGRWSDGKVTTSPGFRAAFRSFGEAGWQGIQHPIAVRRPGSAESGRCRLHGDDAGGQPVVRAVPAADRRRDRGAAGRRHATSRSRRICRG